MARRIAMVLGLVCSAGCDALEPVPRVEILHPTSESAYDTDSDSVVLGGVVTHADVIDGRNNTTGTPFQVHMTSLAGTVAWTSDPVTLAEGSNVIEVSARDLDTETQARASIRVISTPRP